MSPHGVLRGAAQGSRLCLGLCTSTQCWCFTTDWVPMGAAGAGGEGAVTVWAHTLLGRVIPGWKETLHPCPESRFFAAEMNCSPDGGVK